MNHQFQSSHQILSIFIGHDAINLYQSVYELISIEHEFDYGEGLYKINGSNVKYYGSINYRQTRQTIDRMFDIRRVDKIEQTEQTKQKSQVFVKDTNNNMNNVIDINKDIINDNNNKVIENINNKVINDNNNKVIQNIDNKSNRRQYKQMNQKSQNNQLLYIIKGRTLLIQLDDNKGYNQQDENEQYELDNVDRYNKQISNERYINKRNQKQIYKLLNKQNIIIVNQKQFIQSNINNIKQLSSIANIHSIINTQILKCNSIQSIFIYNTSGNESQTQLISHLLSHIKLIYHNIKIISFITHPDMNYMQQKQISLSCLNSSILYKQLSQYSDLVLCFDQCKLNRLCKRNLLIQNPTLTQKNQLLAHQIINIISRFLYNNNYTFSPTVQTVQSFINNLLPYPTLKYIASIYSPISNKHLSVNQPQLITQLSLFDICNSAFFDDLNMCDFDHISHKHLSLQLTFKGQFQSKFIGQVISGIKYKRLVQFVDWSPTGFRINYIYRTPVQLIDQNNIWCDKQISVLSNNGGILQSLNVFYRVFEQNLQNKKYGQQIVQRYGGIQYLQQVRQSIRQIFDNYEQACMYSVQPYEQQIQQG